MKSEFWYDGSFVDDDRVVPQVDQSERELLAEASVKACRAVNLNAPGFGQTGITVERRLGWS